MKILTTVLLHFICSVSMFKAEATNDTFSQDHYNRVQHELEKYPSSDVRPRFVIFMNRLRARHGTPPLELDDIGNLSDLAEDEATYLARVGSLPENNPTGYMPLVYTHDIIEEHHLVDENFPDTNVVQFWYESKQYFNGKYDEENHPKYAPFTQLIWRSSKTVAIAVVTDDDGIAVVAEFLPQGNQPEANYTANVRPMIT